MVMPTGACSNPEPTEAIRTEPLARLEIAWYLLAKCDVALGGEAAIADGLEGHLGDHTIPQCEFSLRFEMVRAAIKDGDTASFVDAVLLWIDAAAYFGTHPAEMHEGLLNPRFGSIPALAQTQRNDTAPAAAAVTALQALLVFCIVNDRRFPAAELLAAFRQCLDQDHSAMALLARLETVAPPIAAVSSWIDVFSNLVSNAPRSPSDSFIASIHLLEVTSRSDYRRILQEPVTRWIEDEWTKIAKTQQFAIASPRVYGPAILAAVARSNGDLSS